MIDDLADEIELANRHAEILRTVARDEPIGIARLSGATGYPRHKVRYSLRVLERDGLIEPTPDGAVTTDRAGAFASELAGRIDGLIDRLAELRETRAQAAPEA